MRLVLRIFLLFIVLTIEWIDLLCAQGKNLGVHTVVIDAGHGGKDPGAVYKTIYEKDITLSVALKLGTLIKENFDDVKVIYTRSTDEFIELHKRAKIANDAKADLFICIHVNSNKKPDPYGAETYVMGLNKTQSNLDVAMTENAVILKEEDYQKQYEGFDPHSPEAYIIFSLYQNAYLDLGLTLSSYIQEEYKKMNRENRGVKQAGFLVLWKTTMPSVLTEIGFITNTDEVLYLTKEKNQWNYAKAIFNAFSKYKGQLEGKKYKELTISKEPENNEKDSTEKQMNVSVKDTVKHLSDKIPALYKDTAQHVDNTFQQHAEKLLNITSCDSIYFFVQLASSVKPMNKSQFIAENVEELFLDNAYKYVCCRTKSFQKSVDSQKEMKKKYAGAFVIALKSGKKIPINDAIKQTNK